MRKLAFLLVIFALFLTNQSAIAQNKMLTCQVVTFDSIPVVNASIKIQSSKKILRTDSLGTFDAMVEPNDKLSITANGFYSRKLKIAENPNLEVIHLKLRSGDRNMNMALQNGHIANVERFKNARELSDNSDVDFSQFTNFFDLIRGRFPNLEVRPGEIIIRGTKSINASNAALIVLDGVPSNFSVLSTLAPADIKRVEVITGGKAMMYGPDSGNGVVAITTKGLNE